MQIKAKRARRQEVSMQVAALLNLSRNRFRNSRIRRRRLAVAVAAA